MLDLLGLSAQHEAVYRAMLQRPDLNVAGLADHLGVPPGQVREALDVLADLALIRLDSGGDSARAVRPQAGLIALLAKVEADVAVRQRQVEATRAAITAIAAAHEGHEQHEQEVQGRALDGLDAVRERLIELAHHARSECLSFTAGRGQRPDTMEAEGSLNQVALGRGGVLIRNVYQDSFRNDPATLAHARWMASLGSQSRTAPTLPMLVALFEQVWHTARPFGDKVSLDEQGLAAQERELLRLLAAGNTDESAARKAGDLGAKRPTHDDLPDRTARVGEPVPGRGPGHPPRLGMTRWPKRSTGLLVLSVPFWG